MSFLEVVLRLLVATFCGGAIGIERGKKNRPAGFRTYILVCVGASLTMILGEYLAVMYSLWSEQITTLLNSDIARFGAQVINGIGFLGAGTIIITGNQQVKGMTTAAGLWASACMGLAIGAGFYEGALVTFICSMLTVTILWRVEYMLNKVLLHSIDKSRMMVKKVSVNDAFDRALEIVNEKDAVLSKLLIEYDNGDHQNFQQTCNELAAEADIIVNKAAAIFERDNDVTMQAATSASRRKTALNVL